MAHQQVRLHARIVARSTLWYRGAVRQGATRSIRPPKSSSSGRVHRSGAPGDGWRVSPGGKPQCRPGMPVTRPKHPRNPMSMPSRSRTGSGPLVAGLISLVVVAVVVGVLAAAGVTVQQVWDSFFPVDGQTPVTDRGVATRALYNLVFAIGALIFVLVEAMIVFTVVRYRRKPGDDTLPPADPRQQPGRGDLDRDPHGDRAVPVRHVLADAQHRPGDAGQRRLRPRRGGPLPVAVRLPGRARRHRCQGDLLPDPAGRPGWRPHPSRRRAGHGVAQERGREPRLLRPDVPVQAGRHSRQGQRVQLHGRGAGHLPRPVR